MSILLSGPAGSGKSARARELLSQATKPTIVADFTSLFNAVRLIERQPDGTFPVRTDRDNVYPPNSGDHAAGGNPAGKAARS